jgi:hypothetical protein
MLDFHAARAGTPGACLFIGRHVRRCGGVPIYAEEGMPRWLDGPRPIPRSGGRWA